MILRVCLAASLLSSAPLQLMTEGSLLWLIAAGALALALCLGALTPLCCCLSVFFQFAVAQRTGWASPIPALIEACQTLALALLGAGAYSLDARLYGRRVLIFSKRHDQ